MPERPRARRICTLLVVFVVVPVLAVVAGPTSAAQADQNWPPVIDTGGSTGGTGSGGCVGTCGSTGSPGGGTSTGGGGTGTGQQTGWVTGYVAVSPNARWPIGYGSEWADCKPLSDRRKPVGFSWQVEQGSDQTVDYATWSYTCDYPPPPVDVTITCPAGGRIVSVGPMDNPDASPVSQVVTDVSSEFVSGGERNPTLCGTRLRVSGSVALTAYGHYKLTGRYAVVSCTERTYPGSKQRADILGCGAPVYTTSGAVGSVWCRGWSTTWVTDKLFTADDCRVARQPLWACKPMTVSVAGGGASASVLDDDRTTTIRWGAARAKGLRSVKVTSTRVTVAGGTPAPNRDLHYSPVLVKAGASSYDIDLNVPGDVRASTAVWMAAGDPGKPSLIRKIANLSGLAPTEVVRITAIDLATGTPTWTTSTGWTRTSGTCSADARVTVYRARNASG